MILLSKDHYDILTGALEKVPFNHLFADAVINKRINGQVYVDDQRAPDTFYIVHPYGMSLLFGNECNHEFNKAFKRHALNLAKTRSHHEWMQVYPSNWNAVLANLFGSLLIKSAGNVNKLEEQIVELNTRVNFKFNKLKFLSSRPTHQEIDKGIIIKQNATDIYRQMNGSVVPNHFWDSAEDFNRCGTGFSLYHGDILVATAFSSFRSVSQLEIGIETAVAYRGKGSAQMVCIALINYCLENGLEPVWACRLENTGSFKLAEKLGFEPVVQLPYYRLSR